MDLGIVIPNRVQPQRLREMKEFIQGMMNRLVVGFVRYGGPTPAQCYMSRAEAEMKAYRRTGNREHLLNLANYAILESIEPENPRYHWDNKVASVTKRKFGSKV